MPVLTVHHTTTYDYRRPVGFGEHQIMARPQAWDDQRIVEAQYFVSPHPARLTWSRDAFENWIGTLAFDCEASRLRFDVLLRVQHRRGSAWPSARFAHEAFPPAYRESELASLRPWLAASAPVSDPVRAWALEIASAHRNRGPFEVARALNAAIKRFRYVRRCEKGTQPAAMTLASRSGSCRDLAMLLVEAARSLGFAARFASGYIRIPTDDRAGRLGGGSTHGWAQLHLPGQGWVDFDPTNDLVGSDDLVRVAVAQSPDQVVPVSGSWIGNAADCLGMAVTVTVGAAAEADRSRRLDRLVARGALDMAAGRMSPEECA